MRRRRARRALSACMRVYMCEKHFDFDLPGLGWGWCRASVRMRSYVPVLDRTYRARIVAGNR